MSNLMEYVGLNRGLKGLNQAKTQRKMSLKNSEVFPDHYTANRNDRSDRMGGGVKAQILVDQRSRRYT